MALLTETHLTVCDAVVLFLVLGCYLGGNGGIKSAQGELRETWQWRQRMSTFIQSACAEPVWLPEADEKSSNLTSGLPPEMVFSFN